MAFAGIREWIIVKPKQSNVKIKFQQDEMASRPKCGVCGSLEAASEDSAFTAEGGDMGQTDPCCLPC